MATFNETFFRLQVDDDNKPLSLTAENLAQLNEHVVLKSKSKNASEEVNTTIIKYKSILDSFLQQHNVLNPKDRNTIECRLSTTNFVRKAFLVDGIDGVNHPCIYSFAFYEKMRKTTTMSKLEKKGSCYQSQCFCQKSYLCDGEERTGDFKILLAFTNFNDTKVDLYMSMKGFPVLSNIKTNTPSSGEGKKKRKRKEEEEPTLVTASSSGSGGGSRSNTTIVVGSSSGVAIPMTLSFNDALIDGNDEIDQENNFLPFASEKEVTETESSSNNLMELLTEEGPNLESSNVAVAAPPQEGTMVNSILANINLQHQLWDPRYFMSTPIFQSLQKHIYECHQHIGKLREANISLSKEKKMFSEENERLTKELEETKKLITLENNEKAIEITHHEDPKMDYKSEEKKPCIVDGLFEDSGITETDSLLNPKSPESDPIDFVMFVDDDGDDFSLKNYL